MRNLDRYITTPPPEPDLAGILQDFAHERPDEAEVVLEHIARLESSLALARNELAAVQDARAAVSGAVVWVCSHCGRAYGSDAVRIERGDASVNGYCGGCEIWQPTAILLDLGAALEIAGVSVRAVLEGA